MIREISLKGVGRKYRDQGASFSVLEEIIRDTTLHDTQSLRAKLEDLADDEQSFHVSECTYGWQAKFEQTWAHIEVRIELDPDSDVSTATINGLKPVWQTGIESTWNGKWAIGRSGELACNLTFDVRFVTSDRHHKVEVHSTAQRSNMGNWDVFDPGSTAAHEFGHMLGNPDEYTDPNCPGRSPVNTGTVMDNNSNNVPSRLVQVFADDVGSNVVAQH